MTSSLRLGHIPSSKGDQVEIPLQPNVDASIVLPSSQVEFRERSMSIDAPSSIHALAPEGRITVPRFFRPWASASGHEGYLPDPDDRYVAMLMPDVLRTADVAEKRCVVILGEPGIGKSTYMEGRRSRLAQDAVFFDLRSDYAQDVLAATALSDWMQGQRSLHLVIDSLDESTDPNLPRLLAGKLMKGPAQSLRLELACRSADWSGYLHAELTKIFGDELHVLRLERLRRVDVQSIARGRGVAVEDFLRAVSDRSLEPLACLPLTLDLLLQIFARSGALPHQGIELYEQSCLHLCSEVSPSRQSVLGWVQVDAQQRLDLASAMAAALLFSRKSVISSTLPDLVSTHVLCTATISQASGLSKVLCDDALSSGLFVRRSGGSSFFHKTIAEFLAARWLSKQELAQPQLRDLLYHQTDRNVLAPPLVGTTSWLACFNAAVLASLARVAPAAFARADTVLAGDNDRRAATEAMLASAERDKRYFWLTSVEYRRLGHAQLLGQLKEVVLRSDVQVHAVFTALQLARHNRLAGLEECLCALACNVAREPYLRANAIEVAFEVAADPNTVAAKLRHLAEPGDESDPDEEVRAAVLEALWPRFLDVGSLLGALTPPRNPSMVGSYQQLFWTVASHMSEQDLPIALRWVRLAAGPGPGDNSSFERLASAIICRAWECVESRTIRTELAESVLMLLKCSMDVLGDDAEKMLSDDERRRLLVQEIAERHTKVPDDVHFCLHPYGHPPLILERDIEWVLECAHQGNEKVREFWQVTAFQLVLGRTTHQTLDAVLNEIGQDRTSPLLPGARYIDLGSEDEGRARTEYLTEQDLMDKRDRSIRRREEILRVDVECFLIFCQGGDWRKWCELVAELGKAARATDGPHSGDTLQQQLRWNESQQGRRTSCVFCARAFLLSPEAQRHQKGKLAKVICQTLDFVREVDREWFDKNASSLYRDWADGLVASGGHHFRGDSGRQRFRNLIEAAFTAAPQACELSVRAHLLRELARRSDQADLGVLVYVPSGTPMARSVRETLRLGGLSRDQRAFLFRELFRLDRGQALAYARWIARAGRRRLVGRRIPLAIVEAIAEPLLSDGRLDSWNAAWGLLQRNPAASRSLLSGFGRFRVPAGWGAELPPTTLAEVYRWCEEVGRSIDQGMSFAMQMQGVILTLLESMEAKEVLAELAARLPDDIAVHQTLGALNGKLREASWHPVLPVDLFALTRSRKVRLVQSSEQLLECVVDALEAYEAHLHGESPAIEDLWDAYSCRPGDEKRFCGHLQRYLQGTMPGVIVNREVEIRRRLGARPGEETDLLVEISTEEAVHSVVLEAKGSWNNGVESSLEDQLSGRYLSGGKLHCGVYVVFWVDSPLWDQTDRRRDVSRRRDRVTTEKLLRDQARALSTTGREVCVKIIDATYEGPAD